MDAGSAFTKVLIYCSASLSSSSDDAVEFSVSLATLLFDTPALVFESVSGLDALPPQAVRDKAITTAKIPDNHSFLFFILCLLIINIIIFHTYYNKFIQKNKQKNIIFSNFFMHFV